MTTICTLQVLDSTFAAKADSLSETYGFTLTRHTQDSGFQLTLDDSGLKLYDRNERKQGPIFVDFVTGANAHRRKFGGGKGQAIAKAVGVKTGPKPSVIDGTAGLGKDAFVLASLGCQVLMVERHPVVRALLRDGLERAYLDSEVGQWLTQRMALSEHNHISKLDPLSDKADVVFLDPMYPHREKSALVKKDMRTFQTLVGEDLDSDELLSPALMLANKRVVVKRPDYALPMNEQKPTMAVETKKHRFDVYINTLKNE